MPRLACFDSPGPLTTQPHHRHFHFFHAGVRFLPDRHLLAQVSLDLLGHFLAKMET